MQEVKKIKVLSVAKISLLSGILFGLIMGIFVTIVSSMLNAEQLLQLGIPAFLVGPIAIIALPIIYGILYFIMGVIGAFCYNVFAKIVGGVKIELVAHK